MTTKYNSSSWSVSQKKRLQTLLNLQRKDPSKTWIGYWCSTAHGRSANGGTLIAPAAPGIIHTSPDLDICRVGLHATRFPHRWQGTRVWLVALLGARIDQEDKSAAKTREIIGEILPEDVIDPSIGLRLELKNLSLASLYGANMSRANMYGANMTGAILTDTNFEGAYVGLDKGAYVGLERPSWLPEKWKIVNGYAHA